MPTTHTGSCLCKQVQFEVEGDFDKFFLCHCTYCQKDSGSAHTANLFTSHAQLKWVSGQDKVRIFNLPGARHTKSFCEICGSALPTQASGFLMVPAGSLDTDPGIRPFAHTFMASKCSWDESLESIQKFDKFPT